MAMHVDRLPNFLDLGVISHITYDIFYYLAY